MNGMIVTRACFAVSFAAALLLPRGLAAAAKDGITRVGVISDTHVGYPGTGPRLEQCYRLFRAKQVDHIINVGDICEKFSPGFFAEYVAIRRKVYGDGLPPETYVYANHDRAGAKAKNPDGESAGVFARVKELLGITNERYDRREIGGYVFLVYPQFKNFSRMKREIDAECAAHPGRPLFVLDHVPPAMTVLGSERGGEWKTRRIFDRHPEIVSISGHVHSSLAYEGNIWQGEFTAIGIGANKNTPHPSNRYYALVIELSKEKAVMRRYDIATGEELGGADPWVLAFPYDPKHAPYDFAARAAKTGAPRFPEGAAIEIAGQGMPAKSLTLNFPPAKGAIRYSVAVEAKRDGEWKPRAVFNSRSGKLELDAGNFDEGETVRFKVQAIGGFRDEGGVLYKEMAIGPLEKWKTVYDGVPAPARPGEWFAFRGGTYFKVPEEAMAMKPGTEMRVTLEVGVKIPADRAASFNLRTRGSASYAFGYFHTPLGGANGEIMRYSRVFRRPKDISEPYGLFLNASNWSSLSGEVMFKRVKLECR